ncbi:dihydrodipicolinate synthase family protein [Thermodesulfobacteriota bacterium]
MDGKLQSPPEGLICPLVTPLHKDNSLDSASLIRLIKHVSGTVDGILLSDVVWGEGLALSKETRFHLVESALEIIRGWVPVFITITCETPKETTLFMGQVETFVDRLEYGGKLFWVDYPLFYHSNKELPQMYRQIMTETQIPLILGNLPSLIKKRKRSTRHHNIRTSVLKKTAQNPSIKGIIYTGTFKRYLNYQQAVRFRQDFVFYDGNEMVFLKNPGTGGLVAGGSNIVPEKWLEITRSSLNRYDTERQFYTHQEAIWESGVMLHSLYGLYKEAPVFCLKQMLKQTGVIADDHTVDYPHLPDELWQTDLTTFLRAYGIT